MTTTKTSLHSVLEKLHTELQQTSTLDATAQQWLETVLVDIKTKLEAQQPHQEDAVDRLEDAALAFEAKHPKLASLATELAESLRAAGV